MFKKYLQNRFIKRLMYNKCTTNQFYYYMDLISGYKTAFWYDLTLIAKLKDVGATIGYKAYLKTQLWAIIRHCVAERFDNRCAVCNGNYKLEVHHRQYKCIYVECFYWEAELVLLCNKCHNHFHKVIKI